MDKVGQEMGCFYIRASGVCVGWNICTEGVSHQETDALHFSFEFV